MKPSVWLIGGPTASGKSALALRLAERLGGVVVNADSMQIYAGLEILSAAPGPGERRAAPHHLYGVADPARAWSVGIWLDQARAVLDQAAGRPAVVVGGTGLYFRALTEGLAPIPPISPAVRDAVRAEAAENGESALRRQLDAAGDPAAARIAPGDLMRLSRALEVLRQTGRSITDWRLSTPPGLPADTYRAVVVELDRKGLAKRIDARLRQMVSRGVLDEIEALMRRAGPETPARKAVGAPEFARVVLGEATLEQALEAANGATRRYAKRQETWFRHQTPAWGRVPGTDPEAAAERLLGSL